MTKKPYHYAQPDCKEDPQDMPYSVQEMVTAPAVFMETPADAEGYHGDYWQYFFSSDGDSREYISRGLRFNRIKLTQLQRVIPNSPLPPRIPTSARQRAIEHFREAYPAELAEKCAWYWQAGMSEAAWLEDWRTELSIRVLAMFANNPDVGTREEQLAKQAACYLQWPELFEIMRRELGQAMAPGFLQEAILRIRAEVDAMTEVTEVRAAKMLLDNAITTAIRDYGVIAIDDELDRAYEVMYWDELTGKVGTETVSCPGSHTALFEVAANHKFATTIQLLGVVGPDKKLVPPSAGMTFPLSAEGFDFSAAAGGAQ